ncbi:MAG: hypothetical protein WAP35_02525 [Solirubrobacterales bacterium]
MDAEAHGIDPNEGGLEQIERMLARAFAPVEPPAHLYVTLEGRLERVSFAAAEELSEWELTAMRDPRNWVKPAVALAVGGAAAGTLVVLGLRSRRRDDKVPDRGVEAVRALGDALSDVRRELERSAKKALRQ